MADWCRLCNKRLGKFSKSSPLTEGHPEIPICEECAVQRDRIFGDEPRTETERVIRKNAVDFFKAKLSDRYVHDDVKAVVAEMVGVSVEDAAEEAAARDMAEKAVERFGNDRSTIPAVTTETIPGKSVAAVMGLVTADSVLGTSAMAEASAVMSNLTGGSSDALEQKIANAKRSAVDRMCVNAAMMGANAVLGVKIDVYIIGANTVGVSATGTAATVE